MAKPKRRHMRTSKYGRKFQAGKGAMPRIVKFEKGENIESQTFFVEVGEKGIFSKTPKTKEFSSPKAAVAFARQELRKGNAVDINMITNYKRGEFDWSQRTILQRGVKGIRGMKVPKRDLRNYGSFKKIEQMKPR